MGKVMVAGASGTLGIEIIKKLKEKGIPIRALIHKVEAAQQVKTYTNDIVIADARKPNQMMGHFEDVDVLISTIGKSVSLFKYDPGNYDSIDYQGNLNLLKEAQEAGVKRVIYTSIMGSGPHNTLKLARVHFKVEQLIQAHFPSYSIIRPTGFFSGLHDWLVMGKRGIIPVIGGGQAKTNSIYQGDLAEYAVSILEDGPPAIELGGPHVHTRLEMAELVREKTKAKIIHVPQTGMRSALFPLRIIKPSLFHNLDYFRFVCTRDMIGETYGKLSFQEYLQNLDLKRLQ